jgi:hypothetical protein
MARGTFEGLLNGMDASFYDGSPNTALHTDICSPVATNPTWSKLPEPARAALVKPGRALWNGLMELLEPHAVLISVARRYLDTLDFASESEWAELDRVERRNAYIVRHRRLSLGGDVTTTAIFGKGRPLSSSLYNNERLIERLGHRTPMRSLSVDPRTRPGHCRKASPEYVCLRDHASEGHIRNVCVDLSRR